MYKLYFCVLSIFVVVYGQDGSMIGPGLWNILSIKEYEAQLGDDLYMNCDAVKRRMNRTHEGYNITCQFEKDFEDSYGMLIDICKKVDGGCKPYQMLTDESIARFLEKYTNENVKNFLVSVGIDPPEFPVPAGSYHAYNYVIDYCSLPPKCPYGEYEATACIIKNARHVGCVTASVSFQEDENDVCGYE